jgi:hypothetical protein
MIRHGSFSVTTSVAISFKKICQELVGIYRPIPHLLVRKFKGVLVHAHVKIPQGKPLLVSLCMTNTLFPQTVYVTVYN